MALARQGYRCASIALKLKTALFMFTMQVFTVVLFNFSQCTGTQEIRRIRSSKAVVSEPDAAARG